MHAYVCMTQNTENEKIHRKAGIQHDQAAGTYIAATATDFEIALGSIAEMKSAPSWLGRKNL